MKGKDKLTDVLIKTIREANEPLETKEIVHRIGNETRAKIICRLSDLGIQGTIKGKRVGGGNGTWIWWKKDAFDTRMTKP
jgi:hypothetical protein